MPKQSVAPTAPYAKLADVPGEHSDVIKFTYSCVGTPNLFAPQSTAPPSDTPSCSLFNFRLALFFMSPLAYQHYGFWSHSPPGSRRGSFVYQGIIILRSEQGFISTLAVANLIVDRHHRRRHRDHSPQRSYASINPLETVVAAIFVNFSLTIAGVF